VRHILAEPLTPAAFALFGRAVVGATETPNYQEETWSSLFPIGKTHIPHGEIGWVLTKKPQNGYLVTGMEREPEVEIIWTVHKPIIHVVAPPGDLCDHTEQPQIEDVRAFIILPGQVIIMHPGTWHAASFPTTDEATLYYFITKDHPREPGWEHVPWVPFIGNKTGKIQLPLDY